MISAMVKTLGGTIEEGSNDPGLRVTLSVPVPQV